MKFFQKFLAPIYDSLDCENLSAESLIDQLETKILTVGDGNQAVLAILKNFQVRLQLLEESTKEVKNGSQERFNS